MKLSKRQLDLQARTLGLAIFLALTVGGAALSAPDMQGAIKKYNAKDYQGALNDLKEFAKAKPNDGLCHYYMALCNQCLARVGEAKLHYQKVLEIGHPSLKANAQTGLNQLEKVTVRYGGVRASGASTAVATATPGLVDGPAGAAKTAAAGKTDGKADAKDGKDAKKVLPNIKRVIMFYSDSSPGSAAMESTWDDAKQKYKDLEFTRLNVADSSNAEMVAQYGVTSYPTTVVLDQGGKVLHNQAGPIMGEAFGSMLDSYLKKK